jgi:hypothetical protein
MNAKSPLYKKLCQLKSLETAWRVVQQNGLQSQSPETYEEVVDFGKNSKAELRRLQKELLDQKFKFRPSRGIAAKKKGKTKKRPIVSSPVRERVVQRAILDRLQKLPAIKRGLRAGFNYGGLNDLGVPAAVGHAYQVAQSHKFFIRTDIKSFFDKVPRARAITPILDAVKHDLDFSRLFKEAVTTELENLAALSPEDQRLFPLGETGLPQGSALSPLVCNLYLADFDREFNSRGIVCLRYIDDFILFARDEKSGRAAFKNALRMLADLGLDAYDPRDGSRKAEEGAVAKGFEFLGCKLYGNQVIPNSASRSRLLKKIRDVFSEALKLSVKPHEALRRELTYAHTLARVSNIVRGWGNTYFFCNDDRVFIQLDVEIDRVVLDFQGRWGNRTKSLGARGRRLSLGVRVLGDRKRDQSVLTTPPRKIQRKNGSPASPSPT